MQPNILVQTISKSNQYKDRISLLLNPRLKLDLHLKIAVEHYINKKSHNELAKMFDLSTNRIFHILKAYRNIVAPLILSEMLKDAERG